MTVILRAFRRHPRWYTAGAVLLVAVVVVATVSILSGSSAATAVALATARTGTLSRTVALTGTIEPAQRADLDFTASGQVIAVDVTVGQQVAAGQALAAVDAASLPSQVAQARSTLASAQARLAADRSAGASSKQIDADEASVAAAEAQLDVARQNQSQATLTAPFAGTVAAVNVTVGQRVSAGGGGSSAAGSASSAGAGGAGGSGASGAAAATSSTSAGSDVVVVSTGSYLVDATVDDTQVGQVKAGQQANITQNGAIEPIPGTVASVGLVATSTSGVASYPVTITVTGSPPNLHLGASAQVEIVTEQIADAVLVPSSAVRGVGAAASVTVYEQGQQVSRPVTVGVTSGGRTQITQGLTSGEQVVLPEVGATRAGTGGGPGGGFGGGAGRGGTGGGGAGGGGLGGGGAGSGLGGGPGGGASGGGGPGGAGAGGAGGTGAGGTGGGSGAGGAGAGQGGAGS